VKTVADYRRLADECGKLAAKQSNPKNKNSLELIAAAGTPLPTSGRRAVTLDIDDQNSF
jgi:hypothetical protein